MHQWWTAAKVLLALAVLVSPACAFDMFPPAGLGGPTDLSSYTRFVHLASGVCPLSFSLNAFPVAKLDFGQCTGYQAINQQNYALQVQPTGGSLLAPQASFGPLPLRSQYYYTVLVMGQSDMLRVKVLDDDPGLPPAHHVRVRFVNAALTAPPLTLSTCGEAAAPVFCDIAPGCASDYRLLPSGLAGYRITTARSATPLVDVVTQPCNGWVYTVVVYGGYTPEEPYRVIVLRDR